MMVESVRAVISVAALAAFACTGQAAVVPVQQSLAHSPADGHGHPPPAGPTVYNLAAGGHGNAPSSYYELIVDPWGEPSKFRTFATASLANTASFNLHADADASPGIGHAAPLQAQWSQRDVPARNLTPMDTHLLGAGQLVLEVGTSKAGPPAVANQVSAVPLPGAIWLLGTALLAFIGIASRHKL